MVVYTQLLDPIQVLWGVHQFPNPTLRSVAFFVEPHRGGSNVLGQHTKIQKRFETVDLVFFPPCWIMPLYPTCRAIQTQVYKVTWYMLHYGGATPKRHYCLANSPHVAGLWVDKLRNWKQLREKLQASGKAKSLVIKLLRSSESGTYLLNRWSVAS